MMSDASFANLDCSSSCVGHLIILVGKDHNCCVLALSCAKKKCVVKSTLAAKMLSLSEGLDHALYLRYVIRELIVPRNLPIVTHSGDR